MVAAWRRDAAQRLPHGHAPGQSLSPRVAPALPPAAGGWVWGLSAAGRSPGGAAGERTEVCAGCGPTGGTYCTARRSPRRGRSTRPGSSCSNLRAVPERQASGLGPEAPLPRASVAALSVAASPASALGCRGGCPSPPTPSHPALTLSPAPPHPAYCSPLAPGSPRCHLSCPGLHAPPPGPGSRQSLGPSSPPLWPVPSMLAPGRPCRCWGQRHGW